MQKEQKEGDKKPSFLGKMMKLTEDTAKNVYDDMKKAKKYIEKKVDEKYDQIVEKEKQEEMMKQQQQNQQVQYQQFQQNNPNVYPGYPVNQQQQIQQPGVQMVYQSNPGQEYLNQMQNKK